METIQEHMLGNQKLFIQRRRSPQNVHLHEYRIGVTDQTNPDNDFRSAWIYGYENAKRRFDEIIRLTEIPKAERDPFPYDHEAFCRTYDENARRRGQYDPDRE